MKKRLTILLCAVLVLSLCACGAGKPQETTAAELTAEEAVELARSYIDKPLSDLIAIIGEPQSRDYAASCLGDGEDGLLVYDGFVVYTYREGNSETVYDAE